MCIENSHGTSVHRRRRNTARPDGKLVPLGPERRLGCRYGRDKGDLGHGGPVPAAAHRPAGSGVGSDRGAHGGPPVRSAQRRPGHAQDPSRRRAGGPAPGPQGPPGQGARRQARRAAHGAGHGAGAAHRRRATPGSGEADGGLRRDVRGVRRGHRAVLPGQRLREDLPAAVGRRRADRHLDGAAFREERAREDRRRLPDRPAARVQDRGQHVHPGPHDRGAPRVGRPHRRVRDRADRLRHLRGSRPAA